VKWCACAALLGLCALAPAQTLEPPRPAFLETPEPPLYDKRVIPAALSGPVANELPSPNTLPDSPLESSALVPIDLVTALRLARTNNLDIAQGREAVTRARVALRQAQLMILPNLNIGSTYVHHEGKIQRTEGNVINANRDSLFVGLGPSMTLSFADALFTPLVARQASIASQAGIRRVQNDTLLQVADAYFAVLRARRRLARVEVTIEYLASEQPSPIRSGSKGLLPVVTAMQKAGVAEALKAEVYRVDVELARRQEERRGAIQDLRVATAELARLLRLDPATPLWPMEDFRIPIELAGPWLDQPVEDQVRQALFNRPETAENQALVQAAVERVRTARFRPLLPNLIVNYSWGDFGGGPDPNPASIGGFGPSGRILHVGTRTDLDVSLMWRLQNMGWGNRMEIRAQESLVRQANLRQIQVQDIVVTQVVQANEQVQGWNARYGTARNALFGRDFEPTGPVFEAIRLNFNRIRNEPKTRPLEVLDSIRGLSDILETYGQTMTDYERSRFRLMIALGMSPEEIISRIGGPTPPTAQEKKMLPPVEP
jgi:outer membrane protein TolC